VNYTDPDGRDIIVFNRSFGAGGFGHNAVMIGNNEKGWIFIQKMVVVIIQGKNIRP